MPSGDLKDIISRIVDLPTLPEVVVSLLNSIDDPNSNASELEKIMANDPAMAARILKLVNSSFYGLTNTVNSIQQAIVILGFNTTKSLALSASVFDTFNDTSFSHEGFWLQSLACALICEKIAASSDKLCLDSSFTVGLLHGIGKVIIEQYAPAKFKKILENAKEHKLSFNKAQRTVMDTTHEEVGYWLTKQWRLPPTSQMGIFYQNNQRECPEEYKGICAAVAMAYEFCRIRGMENGADFDPAPEEISEELWQILEIEPEEREGLLKKMEKLVDRASELFNSL